MSVLLSGSEVRAEPEPVGGSGSAKNDKDLVTWSSPEDPNNPRNWSFAKRWRVTAVISLYSFLTPASTAIVAPALEVIKDDLSISQDFVAYLSLSIFILASAFGPLIVGPLSEVFGRACVLHVFSLIYTIFNTACGFTHNVAQLIVFRFLAGFGGSASLIVGAGLLGDLWKKEERGRSLGLYTLVTLLGPTLGPLIGGFVTQYSSWRWSFWCLSIFSAVVQVAGLFLIPETFPVLILGRRAEKLRHETGNAALHTQWEIASQTFDQKLGLALGRPFVLLFTQPIVQILTLYITYVFGLVYLALSTFPLLWTERYHMSISIGGLHYLALAIGYLLGTQSCARLMDITYRWLTKRAGGNGQPEFRLPMLVPGTLLTAVGLLWYGWSAQYQLHWIMPDLGILLFGAGVKFSFQSIQSYALDVYPTYAASVSAASTFVRSFAGFGFPLFAPYLYQQLGFGWGNSVLALVALLIGLPAPILLWVFGPALRARSPYAAGE